MDIELAKRTIKALKLQTFSVLLGRSDRGEVAYKLTKDDIEEPHFTIDAVRASPEEERELSKVFGI